MNSDANTGREGPTCEKHSLRYDPTAFAGCVLCRQPQRGRAASMVTRAALAIIGNARHNRLGLHFQTRA
jgi:hypothetical protein